MKVIASSLCLDRYDDDSVLFSASCLPLPSQKEFFGKEYKVAESPWANQEAIDKSICEISDYYETALIDISKALNHIHGVDRDVEYWRILIGPAVYWLMTSVYEKYERFSFLQKMDRFVLESDLVENVNCPQKTYDLIRSLNHNDFLNLLITNEVAEYLRIPIVYSQKKHTLNFDFVEKNIYKHKKSMLNRAFDSVSQFFSKFSPIVIYNSGLPANFLFALFKKSFGQISSKKPLDGQSTYYSLNYDLRTDFNRLISESMFLDLFKKVLIKIFPSIYLEGYMDLSAQIKMSKWIKPKIIVSSVGWYLDENFKIWAAENRCQGSNLIGLQHGGLYGSLTSLFVEEHEIKISSSYITWGWAIKENKNIVPLSASKLIGQNNVSNQVSLAADRILFISTSGVRYTTQIWDLPENFIQWVDDVDKFFNLLDSNDVKKIIFRAHYDDRLELISRLGGRFENMKFDNWHNTFEMSVKSVDLVICDNMNTTYLELLSYKKPTLLFWRKDHYSIKASAKKYYECLEKVGILHHTPESIAGFLNQIKDDIPSWWCRSDVQQAVDIFCSQFAKVNENPEREWCDTLIKFKNSIN